MNDQSKSRLPPINSTPTTSPSCGGSGPYIRSRSIPTSATSGPIDTSADYHNPRDSDNLPLTRYNDIKNPNDSSIVLPYKLNRATYETKSSAIASASSSSIGIDGSYKVYNHGPELLDMPPGSAPEFRASVEENSARLKGFYGC